MQAPMPSQRSVQRRSPHADPGPPPSVPPRSISPSGPMPRAQSAASNASARSGGNDRSSAGSGGGSRRQTSSSKADLPLSQIEKSVTHLLVATKQLLETLTQWSRKQATDTQVSDVYVRLGYEFNIACRAFAAINVDTSDLGNVPEELREILESTLSQEASVESLERFLPRIRDIIINLLHGLKRKQQKLRQKQARDHQMAESQQRSSSGGTVPGNEIAVERQRPESRSANTIREGVDIPPPRGSSINNASPNRRTMPRGQSAESGISEQSMSSSSTMKSVPPLPPYPQEEGVPAPQGLDSFPPPPPSPPKQTNALAALQRGGDLERRASRRYSAYQISKHLGASPGGIPMLPTQNSPIPNRGREIRESMSAVQTRGPGLPSRPKSTRRSNTYPNRISEDVSPESNLVAPPAEEDPAIQMMNEESKPLPTEPDISATLQPPGASVPIVTSDDGGAEKAMFKERSQARPPAPSQPAVPNGVISRDASFSPEQSPPPDKPLTLFLQYKTKVKKFVLPDGNEDLTIARLQLAFMETFSGQIHNNGVEMPEIYIQDSVSGARYELEDMDDVKDRSVLVLNTEVLDEVKKHIDDGIGDLRKMVEGIKTAVEDQQRSIERVSDRQQDAAKEMARLATATPPTPRMSLTDVPRLNGRISGTPKMGKSEISEIQNLRRDLAVLRQTYTSFQSSIESSMSAIRQKASSVKSVAVKAAIPNLQGDTGRAYVSTGKDGLMADSDKLVEHVDVLQDMVEDLRKDVVTRGVRPLPRQLEGVTKEISTATQELKKIQDLIKRERPIWTKIWEKELEQVCIERDFLNMQEELVVDLEDDIEKAAATFRLVEEATKEQMKELPARARGLNIIPAADSNAAKEGVLGEVRALQPNHEDRLEAIERAEKLRQKELESRKGGEFQKELGKFVEEGRLKKSGGFEEIERARIAKDERIRREVWERQNGVILDPLPSEEAAATAEDGTTNGEGDIPAAAGAAGGDAPLTPPAES